MENLDLVLTPENVKIWLEAYADAMSQTHGRQDAVAVPTSLNVEERLEQQQIIEASWLRLHTGVKVRDLAGIHLATDDEAELEAEA
jgi:hypothetical protein